LEAIVYSGKYLASSKRYGGQRRRPGERRKLRLFIAKFVLITGLMALPLSCCRLKFIELTLNTVVLEVNF
jgi:hypothetical protein